MGLQIGIVGLPNVGKSTLFNAITNSKVEAANYPFATIDANVGVVEVPDERLKKLAEIFNSKKTVYTTTEFVDIAGLIAGASKGEGLGNAFLANIRETDLICEVVRCFDSKEITHVEGTVDPIRDIEIINLELMLADEATIKKRIERLGPKLKSGIKDKMVISESELLLRMKNHLEDGNLLNTLDYSEDEERILKSFQLLTNKKFIYVANVSEEDASKGNHYVDQVKEFASKTNSGVVLISAKIEDELSELSEEERFIFMDDLGLKDSGLNILIKECYHLLGLKTCFTAGPQEARAWQFKAGMTAPQCAGIIHTDFEKGFIKADVYRCEDIFELKSENEVRNAGKIRLEGKGYLVEDGDVCFFKFNN